MFCWVSRVLRLMGLWSTNGLRAGGGDGRIGGRGRLPRLTTNCSPLAIVWTVRPTVCFSRPCVAGPGDSTNCSMGLRPPSYLTIAILSVWRKGNKAFLLPRVESSYTPQESSSRDPIKDPHLAGLHKGFCSIIILWPGPAKDPSLPKTAIRSRRILLSKILSAEMPLPLSGPQRGSKGFTEMGVQGILMGTFLDRTGTMSLGG